METESVLMKAEWMSEGSMLMVSEWRVNGKTNGQGKMNMLRLKAGEWRWKCEGEWVKIKRCMSKY